LLVQGHLQAIKSEERQKAGALLSVIPAREEWDKFLEAAKNEWEQWKSNLKQYSNCMVLLYNGLAFYEYGENRFWPQFAKAIGKESLPTNQINEINKCFAKAAESNGLKIQQRNNWTDYNGSAVYHIGVPLSLWDGFIEICEWALWRNDWKSLPDERWNETVSKLAGGRVRLRTFLTENRNAASMLVQELLDARRILIDDPGLSIADISQASILRSEYFEEVPETAEFLRPNNPESLFRGRAILTWNDHRGLISLYLPAIDKDKLPATWSIGTLKQEASTTPDELVLNSLSVEPLLKLKLESSSCTEVLKLRGIKPWGLFDMGRGGYFVNSDREQLPYRSYTIVSPERIEELTRKGFEEDENPINEPFELADGTTCFVTRLWPSGKHGVIRIRQAGNEATIRFRSNAKIEAKFFPGIGNRAANFTRRPSENKIVTDQLPTLCLAIPHGYEYGESHLNDKFKVLMDKLPAIGKWEKYPVHSEEKEFYIWKWGKKPFREQTKTGVKLTDFRQLEECYTAPDLKGDRTFSIQSPEFVESYPIYIEHTKYSMTGCWKKLPGEYLIWFLLCHAPTGSKLEDLLLAKDIIAPEARQLSTYLLRKYANLGFLIQRGRLWEIAQSRAAVTCHPDGLCQLDYCGDPSILWGLYRKMYYESPNHELPVIEVINRRGAQEVPYLEMKWNLALKDQLIRYLQGRGVQSGATLWTH
jgi:hypothetical protein